jgi:methyl halide transferase
MVMTEQIEWNDRYRDGDLPWDTGQNSSELQRVLGRNPIQPCRALELGCGTGTNSVWLAQQGLKLLARFWMTTSSTTSATI